MSAKRRFLGRKAKPRAGRVATISPALRRFVDFETLEDRRMLSTIVWTNRNDFTGANDNNFDTAFDIVTAGGGVDTSRRNVAIATVDAAIANWQRVITDFNYDNPATVFNIKISMYAGGTACCSLNAQVSPGSVKNETGGLVKDVGGTPQSAAMTISWITGNTDGGWYIAANPNDLSQHTTIGNSVPDANNFINQTNAFFGLANTSHSVDLFSTVQHELGHAVGLFNSKQIRDVSRDTGVADSKNKTGNLWAVDTANVHSLWTASDTGGDAGAASHYAEAGEVVNYDGRTYYGANALMNSRDTFNGRKIIDDVAALTLQDVYGYSIKRPSSFGTFYDTLDADGTLRIDLRSLGDSDDFLYLFAEGGQVKIDLHPKTPRIGDPSVLNLQVPIGSVQRINIKMGQGDDTISLHPISDTIPIQIDEIDGEGNDTLEVFGTEGYDKFTVDRPKITSTGLNITFDALETLSLFAAGGVSDVYAPHTDSITQLNINGSFDDEVISLYSLDTGTPTLIDCGVGDDTIYINPSSGSDTINIKSAVTVNGNGGADTLYMGSGNIDGINADVTFNGGGGFLNYIYYDDYNPLFDIIYDIGSTYVRRYGEVTTHTLNYTNTLQISMGGNSGKSYFLIDPAVGTEVVAYGNAGDDTFDIGGGNLGLPNANYVVHGGADRDKLIVDDINYAGATEWFIDDDQVFRSTLGVQETDYDGVEAVTVYTGAGGTVGNSINVTGAMHVDLTVQGGSGIDSLTLTNFTNRYNNDIEFLTYPTNFTLGAGLNFLNVDETAGVLTTFQLDRSQLIYSNFFALADAVVDFSDISGGVQINASDDSNSVYVYGVPTTLPDYQNTIRTNGGEDQFIVYPHDAEGHSTLGGNLGLGGGSESDSVTVDDSASPLSSFYIFSNDFGAGTTNVSSFFTAGFGVGGDVENLEMIGSERNDLYLISTYLSPTTSLSIHGGGGDDALAVSYAEKNLETTMSRTVSYSFDGGADNDSIGLYNDNGISTAAWVYYSQGDVVSAFNIGTNYYLPITTTSTELVDITGGVQAELFVIDGVASGKTVQVNGGGGIDGFNVASISGNSKLIQGQVICDGGADGASLIVYDTANTFGSIVHIESGVDATLGSLPGDTLFGPGGSVQFRNLADQSNGVGLSLILGSGADTIYARPQATATLSIDAGNPTASPGDKLNLILAQTLNPVVQSTGVGAGNLTSSNRKTVKWTGIETLDTNAIAASGLLVTNTLDSGPGSLRQALLDANATPNVGGPDVIRFAIPGIGAHTIQPLSPLPGITDPVVVDGTSQPGYAGKPIIEIDGSFAGRSNGLYITSGGTTVRGLAINRFSELSDLDILGAGGNVIQGNYFGTNLAGTAVLQLAVPTAWGIVVSGSDNNTIGTDGDGVNDALEGNVISGHGGAGILFEGGLPGQLPDNNVIAGNRIGTSADGNTALGNGRMGIFVLESGTGNRIGTNSDGISDTIERNLVSGNAEAGIYLGGSGYVVAGNYIGTNAAGTAPLPNGNGVRIERTDANRVGGTAPGASNLIAYNNYVGVSIGPGTGNSVLGNSIYANGEIGIDLNASGDPGNRVTANDATDADSGPNNLQNFPVISAALSSGGQTTVLGTLRSTPLTSFRVELFANATADPSGYGEGQTYLGFATATTDATGLAYFSATLSSAVPVGQFISATATDPSGNTSEFSASVAVEDRLPNVATLIVPTTGAALLVKSPLGSTILASISPTAGVTPPSGLVFPFGFVTFAVQGITQGAATTVTFSGLDFSQIRDYYKYGATPAQQTDHWYDFLFGKATDGDSATGTGMEIVGGNLVLHLIDGGRGDDDLAANGTISDVGGPVLNHAPQANSDTATTNEDSSVSLTVSSLKSNDRDSDGDALFITGVSGATGGAVILSDSNIKFVPAPDFYGTAGFDYTLSDGHLSSLGHVTIIVREINDPPIARPDVATVGEDGVVDIDVRANDSAGPDNESGQTLTVKSASAKHGSVSINANGTVRYRPDANYFGADTISYNVFDNGTTKGATKPLSAKGTVSVSVTPVNDAPIGKDLNLKVTEDGQVSVGLSGSDVETSNSDLFFTVISLPTQGLLSLKNGTIVQIGDRFKGPQSLVYAPGAAREGAAADSFQYTVADAADANSALSDTATVAIDINKAVDNGKVTVDSDGIVRIGGTSGNDEIAISSASNKLQVKLNGTVVSNAISLDTIHEIRVWARGGDDKVTFQSIDVPTLVHGGGGNDEITAGSAANLIFGDAGSDKLKGGSSRDLLLGGLDADVLTDVASDSIVFGGNLNNQFPVSQLRQIVQQWASQHTPNNRFRQGLIDDGAVDSLFDGRGDDWYLIGNDDVLSDSPQSDQDLISHL